MKGKPVGVRQPLHAEFVKKKNAKRIWSSWFLTSGNHLINNGKTESTFASKHREKCKDKTKHPVIQ